MSQEKSDLDMVDKLNENCDALTDFFEKRGTPYPEFILVTLATIAKAAKLASEKDGKPAEYHIQRYTKTMISLAECLNMQQ